MQCKNCSGNEFKQTNSGNFKCSYCSTLYYEESKAGSGFAKHLRAWKKVIVTSAVLLGIVIILIIIFSIKIKHKNNSEPEITNNFTFNNENKLPDPKGEIISVDPIPDSIGNIYFLVMYKNSGKVALNRPEVTIRLFSATDEKIASGSGYAFIENLNPGEITPVYILVTNCPKYKRYETDSTPELPFTIPEGGVFSRKFSGEFIDASLKQTDSYGNFKINGKIKNTSEYEAAYVQVAVILYDRSNKPIGYGSTYINEKKLKPGGFDFFEIFLTAEKAKPEYYKLYFDGSVD